ncbi:putative D-aminoacylase [Nemania abortiva]|nr:putative D-aminoacylase [Nemania abortiva]
MFLPSLLLSRFQALGSIINQICKTAGTPGLSLGVLHHGEIIHQANFGFRDVDSRLPPDENTAYVVGSLTKAITAALVGILVDEGKLTWTTQLHDIIPTFQRAEHDPVNNITITDLLSHRTGLPSYDSLWLLSDNKILMSRADAASILSYVPVAADLRTEFVIEKVRILEPLNMTQTFYTTLPTGVKNVARGYTALQNASVFPVPPPIYGDNVLMGPAGGVRSSVHDLLVLYRALIDAANSQIENRDPVNTRNPFRQLSHILRAMISLPLSTMREASYASGWLRVQLPAPMGWGHGPGIDPMLGEGLPSRLCLFHEGNIPGYTTFTAVFPETSSAVVVLSNSLGLANTSRLVGQLLIEELFGNTVNVTDYTEYAKLTAFESAAIMDSIKMQLTRHRNVSEPANPLNVYTGTYYNSIKNFFIEVRESSGHLEVHFMGLDGFDLTPYQHNSFYWHMSHNDLSQRARYTGYPMEYYIIQFLRVSDEGDEADDPGSDQINALRWKHEFALADEGEIFRKKEPAHKSFPQNHEQLVYRSED